MCSILSKKVRSESIDMIYKSIIVMSKYLTYII